MAKSRRQDPAPLLLPLPPALTPDLIRALRSALCAWFAREARPLPWRESYDPYAVWVSEIMLQQTQVDTVLPYFQRWLAAFPSPAALAAAPLGSVLKAWEGLGYYARGRNLHRAAGVVLAQHGGVVPASVDALRALPGVGRYTAGAIASIGYNRSAAAVDGNVGRVLGRLFGLELPARSTEGERRLWALAEALVPPPPPSLPSAAAPESPRLFNQALMELGALCCRARTPRCGSCPVREHCTALATGDPTAFPPALPRRTPRPVHGVLLLAFTAQGELLLRRRPPGGLWGGLWEPPWLEQGPTPEEGAPAAASALGPLLAALGLEAPSQPARPVGVLEHGLTHRRLSMHCFALHFEAAPPSSAPSSRAGGGPTRRGASGPGPVDPAQSGAAPMVLRWAPRHEWEDLAMSRFGRKALQFLPSF